MIQNYFLSWLNDIHKFILLSDLNINQNFVYNMYLYIIYIILKIWQKILIFLIISWNFVCYELNLSSFSPKFQYKIVKFEKLCFQFHKNRYYVTIPEKIVFVLLILQSNFTDSNFSLIFFSLFLFSLWECEWVCVCVCVVFLLAKLRVP